jgi:hypothetical protein
VGVIFPQKEELMLLSSQNFQESNAMPKANNTPHSPFNLKPGFSLAPQKVILAV